MKGTRAFMNDPATDLPVPLLHFVDSRKYRYHGGRAGLASCICV
jgi:hypothetical protein